MKSQSPKVYSKINYFTVAPLWYDIISKKGKEMNPMPRRPKRPCRYPACSKLTDGVYCEEHQRLMNTQYNHFSRGYNSNERYGRVWRKIRDRYIAAHPLCEMCLANGRYTPADLVHHKKPLSEGGTNDESNLMSLCYSCHEKEHGGRGGQNL